MTVELKGNINYAATVVTVPELSKLENSDRLYGLKLFGYTSVVDETWREREGEQAVLFVAETQLSDQLVHAANLYRDPGMNADRKTKGYIEVNRRIRAIRLRGNHSNAIMLPLDVVAKAFNVKPGELEGSFDTINGREVCRKYEVAVKLGSQSQGQAFNRVIGSKLPAHFDTAQWRVMQGINPWDKLVVSQKLHGTSVRLGNVPTLRKLTWKDKVAKWFGVPVQEQVHDYIAGSRRVIKDGSYNHDIWTEALDKYKELIPKDHVVYGELVGFLPNGKAIQPGFTYEQEHGTFELYVYRVAVVTAGDDVVDLSWDQVKTWCERRGLNTVPELANMPRAEFDQKKDEFWEVNFNDYYRRDSSAYTDRPVALSEGGTGVDEGIAIRVESELEPRFYKIKNASFLNHETKQIDTGEVDTESEG